MQAARALRRIRGVLLDLSGTLYIDTTPTPSAVEALNRCLFALIMVQNILGMIAAI